MRTIADAALITAFATTASALPPGVNSMRTGLPDHILTPGVVDSNVTQANIHGTICLPG